MTFDVKLQARVCRCWRCCSWFTRMRAKVESFQRMFVQLTVAVPVINERILAQNIIYFD
jgi:hypothetical protein